MINICIIYLETAEIIKKSMIKTWNDSSHISPSPSNSIIKKDKSNHKVRNPSDTTKWQRIQKRIYTEN